MQAGSFHFECITKCNVIRCDPRVLVSTRDAMPSCDEVHYLSILYTRDSQNFDNLYSRCKRLENEVELCRVGGMNSPVGSRCELVANSVHTAAVPD